MSSHLQIAEREELQVEVSVCGRESNKEQETKNYFPFQTWTGPFSAERAKWKQVSLQCPNCASLAGDKEKKRGDICTEQRPSFPRIQFQSKLCEGRMKMEKHPVVKLDMSQMVGVIA